MLESAHSLIEFEIQQNNEKYHLRLVHFNLIFWLQRQEAEDWLWIVEKGANLNTIWPTHDKALLHQHVNRAIDNQQLGRALVWEESDEEWLLLWRGASHAWMNPRTGETINFESQTDWHEGDFWKHPNERFHQRFKREWENPDCDARIALEFLRIGRDERLQGFAEWQAALWGDAARIIRHAMRVEFGQVAGLKQRVNSPQLNLEWGCSLPIPTRLQTLLETVSAWNMQNEKLKALPRCARYPSWGFRSIDDNSPWMLHNLEIYTTTPSMHEKLEARLLLVDWLREHAPQLVSDWA